MPCRGGGAFRRPSPSLRFFEDRKRRRAVPPFLAHLCGRRLCTLFENFDPRSPKIGSSDKVTWPNLRTSLRSCCSYSLRPLSFKPLEFRKDSTTQEMCISDFDICDPRSDRPIISQWVNIQMFSFLRIRIQPLQFCQVHDISGHSGRSICMFCAMTSPEGHLRSYEVTRGFLRITQDRVKIEIWKWYRCVCLVKTNRLICNMTYLGHHVTLTWGQILDLTFWGHHVYVSMRLEERNTMVSKSFSLSL